MATVKLSEYECRRDLLPGICMFCGAPAQSRPRRSFAWTPGWVWFLILVHLIVLLIVALIVTKRMTVGVPVCDEHEGYWRRRTWRIVLTLFAVVGVSIAAIAYAAAQPPAVADDLFPWVCGGSGLLGLAWLIMAAILSARGVRPVRITEDTIELTGVNEEFVDVLRAERARHREEHGHIRYGDERDDYDDEIVDEPVVRRRRRRDDFDDRD